MHEIVLVFSLFGFPNIANFPVLLPLYLVICLYRNVIFNKYLLALFIILILSVFSIFLYGIYTNNVDNNKIIKGTINNLTSISIIFFF